jgi:serine/threonine protein kinase
MGEVYLAHDGVLERDVALKILRSQYAGDEEFAERFRREARSAASLSHPNIVQIYDRGEAEDGTSYIAMEYVPGGTLKEKIGRRGPFGDRETAAVGAQIADALGAAHERGVIHRDIKPQNVLVTASGNLKVTDFGIARAASAVTSTATGAIFGTAGYISPEQALGEPVGPRERPLLARGDPLRDADRRAAFRRRQLHRRVHEARQRAAVPADAPEPGRPGRDERPRLDAARQAPRRPLRERDGAAERPRARAG